MSVDMPTAPVSRAWRGAALWKTAVRAWDVSVGWVLATVLIGLIRGYQLAISPLLPPSCRFHPCCSSYALKAIRVHGAIKGVALASWRLLRCNPWNGGGLDPVPVRGRWQSDILPDGSPRERQGAHVHP